MTVDKISFSNFRNLLPGEVAFSGGVTALLGENGQGKTNILEAVYLFSSGRSFRAGKDADLINFSCQAAKVAFEGRVGAAEKTAEIKLFREKPKKLTVSGAKIARRSELLGMFPMILFVPEHLNLVKAGPAARRRFLDVALCQTDRIYCARLAELYKILEQKNALLKDARRHPQLSETLYVWNEKLKTAAAAIGTRRAKYLRAIEPAVRRVMSELSAGSEEIALAYRGEEGVDENAGEAAAEQCYAAALERVAGAELAAGCSLVGPQRDDFEILLNGRPARLFASQGQQRSCVLALKLAEGGSAAGAFGEQPVYLLDDILSELDKNRQQYIMEAMCDGQIILTACGELPECARDPQVIRVRRGRLEQ